MTPIRILIADDHLVYRLGMRTLLSTEERFCVVGEAANAQEAIALFGEHRPDVVLLDLRMPQGGGIEVVQQIMRSSPAARILVVTSYEMEEEIFQIMQAGAVGYLLKDLGRDVLFEAILQVHAGQQWLPERISSRLSERNARRDLTPRELEIAQFLVRGLTNHEIASVLSISESTVKNHMYSLFAKLGVADRTEAAAFCLTRGIVRADEL